MRVRTFCTTLAKCSCATSAQALDRHLRRLRGILLVAWLGHSPPGDHASRPNPEPTCRVRFIDRLPIHAKQLDMAKGSGAVPWQ